MFLKLGEDAETSKSNPNRQISKPCRSAEAFEEPRLETLGAQILKRQRAKLLSIDRGE